MNNCVKWRLEDMNLPNKLTILRIVIIPLFILFLYVDIGDNMNLYIAALLFIVASLTDLLDGKIARKYNLVTNLGKFLDPIADKVLVLSAFVVFVTVPQIFNANLGNWAIIAAGCGVAVILAREIIVSGFRMVAAGAGIVIAADNIGKYKTVTQMIALVLLILKAQVVAFCGYNLGIIFLYVALFLTLYSGYDYFVKLSQQSTRRC